MNPNRRIRKSTSFSALGLACLERALKEQNCTVDAILYDEDEAPKLPDGMVDGPRYKLAKIGHILGKDWNKTIPKATLDAILAARHPTGKMILTFKFGGRCITVALPGLILVRFCSHAARNDFDRKAMELFYAGLLLSDSCASYVGSDCTAKRTTLLEEPFTTSDASLNLLLIDRSESSIAANNYIHDFFASCSLSIEEVRAQLDLFAFQCVGVSVVTLLSESPRQIERIELDSSSDEPNEVDSLDDLIKKEEDLDEDEEVHEPELKSRTDREQGHSSGSLFPDLSTSFFGNRFETSNRARPTDERSKSKHFQSPKSIDFVITRPFFV